MNIEKPKMRPLTIETRIAVRGVLITALTDQAKEWVRENAAEFGQLFQNGPKEAFNLYVHAGYNCKEVADYLQTAWDAQQWPQEIETEKRNDNDHSPTPANHIAPIDG
jgi:hypothetical protein